MRSEPALAGFVYATILSKDRLEDAVCHRLAQRLDHSDVDAGLIAETFGQVLADHPELGRAFRADLAAVYDRDPACSRYIEPLLYFKGFHALVTHRFAHELWKQGRRDFALYLQSQSSRIFAVDINPAARIGIGIMLDHGTGIVIGETAVVGDDCSILQGVTLGGTGKETGDRHPKIGNNVLISVGAKVLGNIKVGDCSRVGAGSVVLEGSAAAHDGGRRAGQGDRPRRAARSPPVPWTSASRPTIAAAAKERASGTPRAGQGPDLHAQGVRRQDAVRAGAAEDQGFGAKSTSATSSSAR